MESPVHEDGHALARLPADEILRRLDRALEQHASGVPHASDAARAAPVLATDADCTLWDGDVGVDLFEALLEARAARPEAFDALRREAADFGIDAGEDAHAAASALYAAFQAERYPEERAFPMMAWAFAGFREDELAAFVDHVLTTKNLEARIRPGMVAVVGWARQKGLDLWVVSASPRAAVERGVSRIGVPAERVLAMTPRVEGGVLQPELAAPATYGDGKVQALERALPRLDLLAAFGDSAYDAAMLRAARVPVALTPSPKLLALSSTLPGLSILIER